MKYSLILLGLFLSTYLSTQAQNRKDPILLKVGEEEIPLSEFKYAYEKRNTNPDSLYLRSSVEDRLDLFIKFKLKIQDAKAQQIESAPGFQKEFASYKEILAKPFMMDEECLDDKLREVYRRQGKVVDVSHILLKLAPIADPSDTLRVYKKMQEVRQKALAGGDFSKLAQQSSEDSKVGLNKGNLGYITALQTVYPFENHAYNTKVGEISEIFRSKFGYHILKVNQRRENPGTVKIAHIMLPVARGASGEVNGRTKIKAQEIYAMAKGGQDWNALCKQYSQDATSKDKGGLLPEFSLGKVLPELEKAAFALSGAGSISAPIRTDYGWHILKLIEKKPLPKFEESVEALKKEVMKDSRYQDCQKSLNRRLRAEYNFKENTQVLEKAYSKADRRLPQGSWSFESSDALLNEELFSFKIKGEEDRAYQVKDFFEYLYQQQKPIEGLDSAQYAMFHYYQKYVEQVTVDFERERLVKKYPDYALLLKEYQEGLMLFDLMQANVWEKSLQDTVALKKFHEEHKEKYRWKERASSAIFTLDNEKNLGQLQSYLLKNYYPLEELEYDNLYFDINKNTLNNASVEQIKRIGILMKRRPELRLEIQGHADPSENPEIAAQRIEPTLRYFSFEKIDPDRIITKNFGFSKPVSKSDRAKNRRVEFKFYTTDKQELENIFAESELGDLKVEEGVFEKGSNPLLSQVKWKPGSYTLKLDDKVYLIEIYDLKEPREKTYKEARGFVINDFQGYLEQEWINTLRKQYPVEVNQKVLEKIIR